MNVLHVCANPRPLEVSASKQLAVAFFTRLAELNPDIDVTNNDLYQSQPPFVSNDAIDYFWKPLSDENFQPTDAQKQAAKYAINQTDILCKTDVLVLTMPLWCNSMPAIMKAWIDQVIVPGRMFTFGQQCVVPLHKIQKVVLLVSSAGAFKEDDPEDGLTPAIRATFGYVGIDDIAVAWADGQDPRRYADAAERKEMALEAARELAEEVVEMAGEPPAEQPA